MEDTIVVLRFTDLGRARAAIHELKQLDRQGRLRVRGATLVQRSGQGGLDAPRAARDDDGRYMPPAGSISMVLDGLGGPLGVLFARPTEGFRGHGGRSPHEGEREVALEQITRGLEPGMILVIAEVAEPDPQALDSALETLGGTVTLRPARDVYADVKASEEAESRR